MHILIFLLFRIDRLMQVFLISLIILLWSAYHKYRLLIVHFFFYLFYYFDPSVSHCEQFGGDVIEFPSHSALSGISISKFLLKRYVG